VQVLADFASVVIGVCAGYAIVRSEQMRYSPASVFLSATLVALFCVFVFRYFHLYSFAAGPNIREIENLLRAATLIGSGLFVASELYGLPWRSQRIIPVATAMALFMLLLERHLCISALHWARLRGRLLRRVVICGTRHGADLYKKLESNPRLGLACVGFLDDCSEPHAFRERGTNARVLGSCDDLTEVVCREVVDEIIIADPCIAREKFVSIMAQCDSLQVPVSFVPGQVGPYQPWFSFQLLDGIPWAHRRQSRMSLASSAAKRALDVLVSLCLIVLLAPAMIVIALLVKFGSPGPVLFVQDRVGLNGELFSLYKFRSMKVDAPKYGHSPSSPDDPRITPIGRFLRRTSLDELPQLFNVLLGDMSLVGPRPEMPFIVAQYGPVERGRLAVRPGITGLWQISHGRNAPIHDNIDYDLFYIEHQNLFLDFAILLSTVAVVFRGTGVY
jgi:exopolysaccharide biosynthesis polyprenyl glycosylphosphotransferase